MLTTQQQIVQTYTDGFATGDIAQIVSCVSDDLVWEFNGQKVGEGRAAFEVQMRNDLGSGTAEVTIDRFIEQDDVVVALNRGRFVPHGGEPCRSSPPRCTRSPARRSAGFRPTSRWADQTPVLDASARGGSVDRPETGLPQDDRSAGCRDR